MKRGGLPASASSISAAIWVAGATMALAGWLYAMPPEVSSPWGLNHLGLDQFRGLWHLPAAALTAGGFRIGFWLLIAAAWAGYGALLVAGARGCPPPWGMARALAVAVTLAVALGCPPVLSADVYGYVGFGRLAALHHLNPMTTPQSALIRLGDPVAAFLGGDVASPYGPLWTAVSVAVVRATGGLGVSGQVVAFKLLSGAALLAAAAAARRAAGAMASHAAGEAAFAAVALNPLLLLEGPGSGHNDLSMLALVLAALAAVAAGRPRLAALAAGAAAAVKLVPLLLVPWLVWSGRDRGHPGRSTVGLAALAMAPLLISGLPFWDGTRTFAGLAAWWHEGHRAGGGKAGLLLLPIAYGLISWTVVRTSRGRARAGGRLGAGVGRRDRARHRDLVSLVPELAAGWTGVALRPPPRQRHRGCDVARRAAHGGLRRLTTPARESEEEKAKARRKIDGRRRAPTVKEEVTRMDYASTRELVRLRYELRHLVADRPAGARAAAGAILVRITALVAADEREAALQAPDLARWRASISGWVDASPPS